MKQVFISGLLCLILFGCKDNTPGNKLGSAASPYLREHADNPVHWVEWSDDVIKQAKAENKPIIVSVGYSSCHWCHVMERETFMDTAVARVMNSEFICVKVDREERPDLDQVYIRAAEMISGNAGWPLNAFTLPDGRPFFAATYFPKDQWSTLLEQVIKAYKEDFENLEKQAKAVQDNIAGEDTQLFASNTRDTSRVASFLAAIPAWYVNLDIEHGGLSGPNRFPMPAIGEFFLQHYELTKDPGALKWVTTTLNEMAYGGIYDQLGGGFSRYTVDAQWKVPHFEKMLYDNGQLVSLYSHAFQATGDSLYLAVVDETLGFVSAELTSEEGAFYSSINADSEGEEGKYYVWTSNEIQQALNPGQIDTIYWVYGISGDGNWENGKNILLINPENRNLKYRQSVSWARNKLLKARNERPRPSRDEKILTSWNAMMLNGYVDAFRATTNHDYLKTALKNADFLQTAALRDGEVFHLVEGKNGGVPGFLEDYAWTAKAMINLYEVTFDLHWLQTARKITDYAMLEFRNDKSDLFYYSPKKLSNPLTRKTEVYDNVVPSSNSVFAEVLFRLGEYFQESAYDKAARSAITAAALENPALGIYLANWARVAEIMKHPPYQIAVVGPESVARANQLQRNYIPAGFFMGGNAVDLPLLENKLVEGKTIFYVCRNRVCKLPTEEITVALGQIRK